jgi:hypothetical protein
MKFTLINSIVIDRIGIAMPAWPTVILPFLYFKFYLDGNTTPINTYILYRQNIYNSFYTLPLSNNLILPPGTYRYSVGLDIGYFYYNIGSIMVFPPQLTNVQGAFVNNLVDGAYPSSILSNAPISGFFWFYDNTNKIITPLLETLKINNLSPIGGVFMTTSDCATVNILSTPLNLIIGSSFVGSLTVPANTFTISSYSLYISGLITTNNNNNLLIKLLSNSGVFLGSLEVLNIPLLIARVYTMKIIFSIRSIGSSAGILTSSEFTYNQNTYLGSHDLTTSGIDTTISNTLFLTIESTNSTTSSQFVRQCVLTKIY